jgi:hypothetical protein
MSRFGLTVLAISAALAVSAPSTAEATSARLGIGGNYWFVESGVFDFSFSVDTPLASFMSVGGRFGILMTTAGGPRVGVPLDLLVRLRIASPIYIELTGGPWILFNSGDSLRGHFGFGVGIQSGSISFGPEVSYLEPEAMIGVRLSFRL